MSSISEKDHAFQASVAWACSLIFKGKLSKAKQRTLQALALARAGAHVTTGKPDKRPDGKSDANSDGKSHDNEGASMISINPRLHADDRDKKFILTYHNSVNIFFTEHCVLYSFPKAVWFKKELFEYKDIKFKNKYTIEDDMWRKFKDISSNVKNCILPLYYKVFSGPLPSGKQLQERLEELRRLLWIEEKKNKKSETKKEKAETKKEKGETKKEKGDKGEKKDKGEKGDKGQDVQVQKDEENGQAQANNERIDLTDANTEGTEGVESGTSNRLNTEESSSDLNTKDINNEPDQDYFPVNLLAFFIYGPFSSEPFAGWTIPNDEGMGKIPGNPDMKPMSRSDLKQAKEEALNSSVSNSKKRKESSSLEIGIGEVIEEMRLQRGAIDRRLQEMQRNQTTHRKKLQIENLEKRVNLLKELKKPRDVIEAAQEELLLLLENEDF
jgi:hypothetical protein